uniref:Putative LAGLIDADG homing endonuclease n=1 Tax=Monomastix sp. (strain OKE-1) TaxID=141716 RepID=U5YGD4_MONSK|nr:putative LAGLIDADG homing endonuclease [Monomastix sp. OKE-1]AGZ90175.1 putative LAGLIDADG homing endonuclease [Monomastix sp. OKE-1]
MNANTKSTLNPTDAAYLAGLLDGDGSIFVQIVPKPNYNCFFGLQFTINFTQSTKRKHFMLAIEKLIGSKASFRDRKDGNCEIAIYGWQSVAWFLHEVHSYLKFKKPQADLVLKIVEKLPSTTTSYKNFLEVCALVDKLTEYNDSKKRKYTSKYIVEYYKERGIVIDEIAPVETF